MPSISSQIHTKAPHSAPTRTRYGVSFFGPKFQTPIHILPQWVIAVMCALSFFILDCTSLTSLSTGMPTSLRWVVRERRNSIANALELRLSCTNPSICVHGSPAAARRKNPVHSGMLSVSSIRNPTSKASPSDASNEGHWPEAAETSNSSIEPYMGCLLQLVPEDEMAHHCMKLYWLKRWCHICVGMFAASNKGIRALSQYKDSLSQVWGFPS